MADHRFFRLCGPFSLSELASLADAELRGGDPAKLISDVATLEYAGADHVSFLFNAKYVNQAQQTKAGACLIREDQAQCLPEGIAALITNEPYRGYAQVAAAFYPDAAEPNPLQPAMAGISVGAIIDPEAELGDDCQIASGAVIEVGARIGARCRIGINTAIAKGVVLGSDCVIGPNVTLSHCLIGNRVVIHSGVRIGQDGFGFAMGERGHVKVPQIGRVVIEDDVEIGANSTIDRGSGPDTVIGRGCKIDNLVMIAHNVQLGAGCIVVAQSGIAGSTKVGAGTVLAAQSGVGGHLNIGAGSQFAARSGVMRDMEAGGRYGGFPAVPMPQWLRQLVSVERLGNRKGKKE
ncbi:MAG: UDP-3-O-(3-hydroxymyristoyl)glucosamine N-acyltransferase [Geminicoccaceae bacterium]|jgi:UDP-3-O-[3-hydroxymyristoyl] glucosamine N-acyltransferase